MKILLIILALLQGSKDARQQYLSDYKEIATRYKNAASMGYTIKFKSFDTRADRPDTVLTGTYLSKGRKLYSRIGFAETYIDDKYILKIDNAHKIAFINYAGINSSQVIALGMLDSLIIKYKCQINYQDLPGDIRKYTIGYVQGGQPQSCIMEFNIKTHLISKVTMYFTPEGNPYDERPVKSTYKPFIEFIYTSYSFSDIPDAAFATDKYVEVKGQAVTGKGVCARYQIVNSLLYNKEKK